MTTFGKILVFINLGFSLVVCGLIIMVYIARTNWRDAFAKQEQQTKAAWASADASAQMVRDTLQEMDKQTQVMQAALDKTTKDLEAAKRDVAIKESELEKLVKKGSSLGASEQKLLADLGKRTEEVKKLEGFLTSVTEEKTELVRQMNKLRDQATALAIENRSFKARNEGLVNKLEESEKDRLRMKTVGTTTAGKSQFNPPADNVEGVVKRTDSSGLVTITIGSDSGILKGHTLEVYRLQPSPQYLGTIRILETTGSEAVGQPLTRPRIPIMTGDRVASRIGLGS